MPNISPISLDILLRLCYNTCMKMPDLEKPIFQISPHAKKCVENLICPFCEEKIDENHFSSEISKKEYSISGICQNCQNEIFGNENYDFED